MHGAAAGGGGADALQRGPGRRASFCSCHAHVPRAGAQHHAFKGSFRVSLVSGFWVACRAQACMVLRLEVEKLTQYNEDLDAERRSVAVTCMCRAQACMVLHSVSI